MLFGVVFDNGGEGEAPEADEVGAGDAGSGAPYGNGSARIKEGAGFFKETAPRRYGEGKER
jgi:hypothetical protein